MDYFLVWVLVLYSKCNCEGQFSKIGFRCRGCPVDIVFFRDEGVVGDLGEIRNWEINLCIGEGRLSLI